MNPKKVKKKNINFDPYWRVVIAICEFCGKDVYAYEFRVHNGKFVHPKCWKKRHAPKKNPQGWNLRSENRKKIEPGTLEKEPIYKEKSKPLEINDEEF